ncbi:MAG: AAA family ATPase [Sphingopyxis sp.]|nr:AAA family ATPase [Sphingopyxis sp.]
MPIATSDKRHGDHIEEGSRPGAPGALRIAAIYGANGHGKTRLVQAVRLLKRLVTVGGRETLKEIKPFRWKKSKFEQPSRFEISFRTSLADYDYGIIADGERVFQEWLFETRKKNESLMYSREYIPDKKSYKYEFGSRLKGAKSPVENVSISKFLKVVSSGVDDCSTFIEAAFDNDLSEVFDPYDWLANVLQPVGAESTYAGLHSHAAKDEKFLEFLSEQLKLADTGMSGLKVKKSNISGALIESFLSLEDDTVLGHIKEMTANETVTVGSSDGAAMLINRDEKGDFEVYQFFARHEADYGDVDSDIIDESSGTRRLMDLFPMLYSLRQRELVYVVDELDRKLHPLLAYRFLSSFLEQGKGQLIFTTHTTYILDLDLLRRDEIWLMQKKDDGASEIYSLADFKVRPDLDVRKGYLQGRFGAVPFLGDLKSLGWC